MSNCSVAGCENTVIAKGMCNKHYIRFKRFGDTSVDNSIPLENLSGKTFGRWSALSIAEKQDRKQLFNCVCSCGVTRKVRGDQLKAGISQSCGCLHLERITRSLSDREAFMSRVRVSESGCWEYLTTEGEKFFKGYAQFTMGGNAIRAHRASLMLFKDIYPKETEVVCHACDNPCCVNPDHLFVGTSQDNIDDKVVKGRQSKGEEIGVSKLTEAKVLEIRSLLKGHSYQQVADIFGVTKQNVYQIKHRKTWKHI